METKRLDRSALGEFVRKERRKRKLKQGDLIDDVLSQAMISYIETGNSVGVDKITHLLNKLGFDAEEIMEQFTIQENQDKDDTILEEWTLRLTAAECLISLRDDLSTDFLRSIHLPSGHPFQVWMEYLKGKFYYSRQKWEKAQYHFLQGIQLLNQYPSLRTSNLESACLHQLSRIEYLQNRFQAAIRYSKKALSSFDLEGERKYYKDLIVVSQVIYLEKMNRIGEAHELLEKFGSASSLLSYSKEATLNYLEIKSKLLAKSKQFHQAIEIALRGIELARIDQNIERAFELWTTLGGIYIETNKPHLAEICFRTALKLRNKIKRSYLLAYIHNHLGTLQYRQKEIEKAENEFSQALKYSKKGDIFWEVESLIGLGKCALSYDANKAITHFQQALDKAKQHQLDDKKTEILLFLGKALILLGDPQLQNVAMDLLYSQLEVFKGGEDMLVKRHSAGDPPGD